MLKPLDKLKVFVIGGNYAIERIFLKEGATIVGSLDAAHAVVWTGGADVNPTLYNEAKHPRTHSDHVRDRFEQACWFRAQEKKKLKIGICRGGQFLNVMNGGPLWQHVDGHALAGVHPMTYRNGAELKEVLVTSTHHQQMIPNRKTACEVWGFAGMSTTKESGLFDNNAQRICFYPKPGHASDAEIIWYPESRSLCFQPHPEYSSLSTRELFFECIERTLVS